MHRPVVVHSPEALGGHRPLERMENGIEFERPHGEGARVGEGRVVRIAKVPGEAVEIAKDMTAGTRRVAVARGVGCVVEEAAPVHHRRRLGVEHRLVSNLAALGGVDDRNRVVESGQHVEEAPRLVQHHAGGTAAGQLNLIGDIGDEAVVFEGRGVEYPQFAGAKGRDVQLLAVAGHRHLGGEGQALHALGIGVAAVLVVDMLVEMSGQNIRPVEDGDPALGDVSSHRLHPRLLEGIDSRSFEAGVVSGVGVGDVDFPGDRIDGHVEQDRAHAGVDRAHS